MSATAQDTAPTPRTTSATTHATTGETGPARDLLRVLGLWRNRTGLLVAGAVVACISALAGIALLTFAGDGVASGLATGTVVAASASLILLRPLIFLRPFLRWADRMVAHDATFRALADTRVWFFRRLAARLPTGPGMRSGDLLGRLVSDVEALDGLYLRALVPLAAAAVVVLAIAVILGAMSLTLAALVAIPLAAALLLPILVAPAAARAAAATAEATGTLRAEAAQPLMALEDIAAANAEPRAIAAIATAAGRMDAARRRLVRAGALGSAAGTILTQAALLAALAWGVASGSAAVAGTVIALFLVTAAAETVGLLPRAGSSLALAAAGARRLFEASDRIPAVTDPGTSASPAGHAIAVRDLSFRWSPDRPLVFDGLSFDLPEGARLALLGPSGSGKSTLAALLLKLAAPGSGTIALGGADYATLTAETVRARIATLTQDATLFDDTVAANLRLAAPDAPDAALWHALERAHIADLIRSLPDGLATRCGEGGGRFSGGQSRRIALARALLSPASVIILDEPTAGLDADTERDFLSTLDDALGGRSAILITHRLTGVERPTRILRLAGGRALPAAA
ncbi:thiol reductant ABC exporter subunit CydC [Roseomonas sp. CCTCC AB2023176]|uniref:thiol reductant ABC exporter subunit CydC n=1 Tax=Roseomonas sp. CCTCC AB2023176 TaxID=3342640 RepID=UPI0035D8597A